ncbi:MAG: hypothetical protein KDB14_25610 [Planctomycetales bacterium]|nr:hypothetical protein [Planctomycetales bacterium]
MPMTGISHSKAPASPPAQASHAGGARDRRHFLRWTAAALAAPTLASLDGGACGAAFGQAPVYRREGAIAKAVEVLLPRLRVPLSFVIDDSTCLVNMGHYCMPQFATAWPERDIYRKPWKSWPREIPDSFVREFIDFCDAEDVKGKYSIVPYPACVGWVDRELPGWSRRELQASLKLVRDRVVPRFDIHPEMITHTRVIDLKTGRPLEEISAATMENSYPRNKLSVDELAAYLAYALRVLRNCDLPCEGVTTPGGFGNMVKSELALAVFEAVRDVYGAELPHYFKYVEEGLDTRVRLEHVREPLSNAPRVTANVPAATGDWFGGWDGDRESEGERYASDDASSGRMVELIERRQPAVMLCHWPGMYGHGGRQGFEDFRRVVRALNRKYADTTQWMKLSEMGRYAAARELTRVAELTDSSLSLEAPFACPQFTLALPAPATLESIGLRGGAQLERVDELRQLKANAYWLGQRPDASRRELIVCFDLPKGDSRLEWK